MLGNCDDEILITPVISSTTTNQWPQNQILLDDHKTFMASSSSNNNKPMAAEKAAINPDPHPLKCPRCDSSNTKFCYYNNYSLSQPRHFCKACKRYWTRGGTLRNVPVGGGCRKNKRSKRHSSAADGIPSPAAANTNHIDLPSSATNHNQNPLLYGLPTNPLELNFPVSSFRVSSDTSAFNLHPRIDGLGLGFGSDNGYKNGFKSMQDVTSNSSSPPFSASANNSIFSAYSSSFSTSSTMASLLASTLQQQQKFASKDVGSPYTIPGLMPYEDPQVKGEGENRFSWNPLNTNPNPNSNPIDQINSSDPSSLLWNNTSMSAWFDPSTMGSSSVPSLI